MVRDCCLEAVRALIPISPPPWATKSQQIFPSPAAQSFLVNGRKHRVFGLRATLVPATPGWEICGLGVCGRILEICFALLLFGERSMRICRALRTSAARSQQVRPARSSRLVIGCHCARLLSALAVALGSTELFNKYAGSATASLRIE